MSWTKAAWMLIRRELQLTWRSRASAYSVVMLGGLLIVLFAFLLSDDSALTVEIKTGVWWASLLLSATWLLHQSMGREVEQRTWRALWLAPVPRNAVLFAKSMVCAGQVVILGVVLYPLAWWLLGWHVHAWLPFVLLGMLGAGGMAWLGCTFAAAAPPERAAHWLALLVYPLLAPLLLAVVKGTAAASYADGEHLKTAWRWVRLLVVFDAMVVLLGLWLFESLATPEDG